MSLFAKNRFAVSCPPQPFTQELEPKFDIRTFHDEMLNGGILPLDLLDARTNSWIQAQIGAGNLLRGIELA
jgi:hypothetical protein